MFLGTVGVGHYCPECGVKIDRAEIRSWVNVNRCDEVVLTPCGHEFDRADH